MGLAFSGGGFRATAFGLGCLRALHDRDLLRHVSVVSGVSGGSLLAAMWAYGPERFDEFDDTVVTLLRKGLHSELIRRACTPHALWQTTASSLRALGPGQQRSYSRTEALVETFASREFGAKHLTDTTHAGLATIISATDMTTGNAVRFGNTHSACSAHGRITEEVSVAEAVAASVGFPLLFPALHRRYSFERRDGSRHSRTVVMTDGGVYDNLGLAPLLPGRSTRHSPHVCDLDYIIAVDAGRGRADRTAARFMAGRLSQSFDITHTKSQGAARRRIHAAGTNAEIGGFLHVYLGMSDERLPTPIADLIPRTQVDKYPTNFSAMAETDLAAIAVRGEQLVRSLVNTYTPDLSG